MSREIVPSKIYKRIWETIGAKKKKDMAEALGISQQSFSNNVKRGTLLLEQLWKICDNYDVSMDWLLTGDKPEPEPTVKIDPEVEKLERMVAILERHIARIEADNERMRKELGFTEDDDESLSKRKAK